MFGNLALVIFNGYGSISDAHAGTIPHIVAASGAVPEPSNRLPNFTYLSPFVLWSQITLCDLEGKKLSVIDAPIFERLEKLFRSKSLTLGDELVLNLETTFDVSHRDTILEKIAEFR